MVWAEFRCFELIPISCWFQTSSVTKHGFFIVCLPPGLKLLVQSKTSLFLCLELGWEPDDFCSKHSTSSRHLRLFRSILRLPSFCHTGLPSKLQLGYDIAKRKKIWLPWSNLKECHSHILRGLHTMRIQIGGIHSSVVDDTVG